MKKEVTLSVVFNVISILISFGFISYLSKSISLNDFGKFQLVISYIGFIGVFSLNGINMIINKSILNGEDYIFKNTFIYTYKNVFKFFLFLLGIVVICDFFIDNERINLFIVALLFLPLLGLERYEAILYAKQKFVKIRVLKLLNAFFYVLLAIILLEYSNNFIYVFVSMFVVKLLIIIFGLKYSISLLENNKKIDCSLELREGYKLSFLSFYNVGIGYLDKLILGFIDYKLLAIYSVGILIPLRIKDQLKLVITILVQRWAKDGENIYIDNVKKYSKYIFILALCCSFFISSTASFYIPILFSKEYMESEIIIWIVGMSIPFILSAFIYETFIVVFHDVSFYKKVTYSKQVVYLIMLSILIPSLGIVGVALAFLIRSMYDFLMNYIYFYKYNKGTKLA